VLLAKLRALGIGDPILSWIRDFVTGRTQTVKLGGCLSDEVEVPSGVPQGSHSGPVLFCLFLVDITRGMRNSRVLVFADDVKMFREVASLYDALCLQNDLDLFFEWCEKNKMELNINKCHKISFTRQRTPVEFTYSINQIPLNIKTEISDLGVLIDSRLTFSSHISQITSKAMKVLGFIQRSSSDFSIFTFRRLYCTLVRPILEYCSVVWSPSYACYIKQLERVQNKFLRIVAFKSGYHREEYEYEWIRGSLNLPSLESRRILIDMSFLHKIINAAIDCPELLALIRLRQSNIFYTPFHRTNYGINEPISRMVCKGNTLAGQINFFDSKIAKFKRDLLNVL